MVMAGTFFPWNARMLLVVPVNELDPSGAAIFRLLSMCVLSFVVVILVNNRATISITSVTGIPLISYLLRSSSRNLLHRPSSSISTTWDISRSRIGTVCGWGRGGDWDDRLGLAGEVWLESDVAVFDDDDEGVAPVCWY